MYGNNQKENGRGSSQNKIRNNIKQLKELIK